MDLSTIATPNLPELRRLTSEDDPVAAALALVFASMGAPCWSRADMTRATRWPTR